MKVGSVKEIKNSESRVGLIPSQVTQYIKHGHDVYVEAGLGLASGFADEAYADAGAHVLDDAKSVWEVVELMLKVKEPMASEYQYLHEDLILFAYLHLAGDLPLTKALIDSKVKAVAYETVTDDDHDLPLLVPMSLVAGRLAIQEGAKYLEHQYGGKGILLSGLPDVAPGHVLVIGGGNVGLSACEAAVNIGAKVTLLDRNTERMKYVRDLFEGTLDVLYSNETNLLKVLPHVDLIVGSVLIPGGKAPKIVRREHLALMEKGTVLVDVAIDQGGCFETSRPTDHGNPVYIDEGIVHYCVSNMPGAVPKTSTLALTSATLPIGLEIADHGLEALAVSNVHVAAGINLYKGLITNENVALAHDLNYSDLKVYLKSLEV